MQQFIRQSFINLVAGTTGLRPSWENSQQFRTVYALVCELGEIKRQMETSEIIWRAKSDILDPHKDRLVLARMKFAEMQDFFLANDHPDAQHNVEVLGRKMALMGTAIEVIETEMQAIQKNSEDLQKCYDDLFMQVVHLIEDSAKDHPASAQQKVTVVISDEMFSPDALTEIEQQCADFDAALAEEAEVKEDEYLPHVEEEYDDDETTEMRLEFAQLKIRKQTLSAETLTESVQEELDALEERIAVLTRWLAIRGIAVKDGRVVAGGGAENEDDDAFFRGDLDKMQDDHEQHSAADFEQTLFNTSPAEEQRGLFDGALVEKPTANDDEAEQRVRTLAEINVILRPRILSWLSTIDDTSSEIPAEEPDADYGRFDELQEIEVGEHLSFEDYPLPKHEVFQLQTRKAAWQEEMRTERLRVLQAVREESPWITLPPNVDMWGSNSDMYFY